MKEHLSPLESAKGVGEGLPGWHSSVSPSSGKMACQGSRPYGREECLGDFLESAHGMSTCGRGVSGIRQREKLDSSVVLVET